MNATQANRHLIGGYIPERLWNRYEEAFKTEFRNNDGVPIFKVERTSSGLVEVVGYPNKIELANIERFHRGFRAGAGLNEPNAIKAENKTTGHTRTVRFKGLEGNGGELLVQINYLGDGNAEKGVTIDNEVIPAIMRNFDS